MVLVRRHLGTVLRAARLERALTLRELSAMARVSTGYISEVERGQKEASSELLASLCDALDVGLGDVLREVGDLVTAEETQLAAAVDATVTVPVPLTIEPVKDIDGDVVAAA
ncbi:helix-turn-helix domain-containing protein [Nocardioidaceae bacterium]|nr:helix-turn-helix domain-containing protein [Nocardioidaceae bacterium]